jgi:hypothetical protein
MMCVLYNIIGMEIRGALVCVHARVVTLAM